MIHAVLRCTNIPYTFRSPPRRRHRRQSRLKPLFVGSSNSGLIVSYFFVLTSKCVVKKRIQQSLTEATSISMYFAIFERPVFISIIIREILLLPVQLRWIGRIFLGFRFGATKSKQKFGTTTRRNESSSRHRQPTRSVVVRGADRSKSCHSSHCGANRADISNPVAPPLLLCCVFSSSSSVCVCASVSTSESVRLSVDICVCVWCVYRVLVEDSSAGHW